MDLLLGISLSKTINNNCHDGPLPLQLAFLFIAKAKASMQTIISHSLTSVRLSHFSFPRLPTCFPECQTMFFNTIKWLIIPCFFRSFRLLFCFSFFLLHFTLYTLYFSKLQTVHVYNIFSCLCIKHHVHVIIIANLNGEVSLATICITTGHTSFIYNVLTYNNIEHVSIMICLYDSCHSNWQTDWLISFCFLFSVFLFLVSYFFFLFLVCIFIFLSNKEILVKNHVQSHLEKFLGFKIKVCCEW